MKPVLLGNPPTDALGAVEAPWQLGGTATPPLKNDFSGVAVAKADVVTGFRLYVQSVTVSNQLDVGEVSAALTLRGSSRSLPLKSLLPI